jgi:hypothetical protein
MSCGLADLRSWGLAGLWGVSLVEWLSCGLAGPGHGGGAAQQAGGVGALWTSRVWAWWGGGLAEPQGRGSAGIGQAVLSENCGVKKPSMS